MQVDRWARKSPLVARFSSKEKVTGAEIGSAAHGADAENWPQPATNALATMKLSNRSVLAVRDKINLAKMLAFFDLSKSFNTITSAAKQPSPYQKRPKESGRHIVRNHDGYLLYEDEIVLFDYKTNTYDEPSTHRPLS